MRFYKKTAINLKKLKLTRTEFTTSWTFDTLLTLQSCPCSIVLTGHTQNLPDKFPTNQKNSLVIFSAAKRISLHVLFELSPKYLDLN